MNDSTMPPDNRLNYTENDVRAIRDALLAHGGVEKSDMTILTDADRPDRNKILSALRDLANRAGPDDRIIFFFSGHGGKKDNTYGNIIPHGYRRWDDGVMYSKDIKPILEKSRAASKWMIIDACHSGLKSFGFEGVKTLDGYVPDYETENLDMMVSEREAYSGDDIRASFNIGQRVPELIRFTGAHGGEATWESGTIEMGYFAHFVADGLKNGKADKNGDGEITGGELCDYVTPKVLAATKNKQKPRLTENGAGIILAATKSVSQTQTQTQNNPYGKTQLQFAVSADDYSKAERLLASGANVNETDNTGWTALHYARNGRMVRLLLSNRAKVNVQSGGGYSPLHIAAIVDRVEVIYELLRNGANRNLKDKQGRTALHRALEYKNTGAIQALRNR